jgi:NAD(P)-dependent dehydrogenase (short-subunit alcohol dehydrogenase family)
MISPPSLAASNPPSLCGRQHRLNGDAAYGLVRAFLPAMAAARRGHIVLISSLIVKMPHAQLSTYYLEKAKVNALATVLQVGVRRAVCLDLLGCGDGRTGEGAKSDLEPRLGWVRPQAGGGHESIALQLKLPSRASLPTPSNHPTNRLSRTRWDPG